MTFNFKKEIIIFLAIFLVSSFLVYLFLNSDAYFTILRYDLLSRFSFAGIDFPNQPGIVPSKDYYLQIPKINASAPIVFPADDSIKSVLASLELGVALYPGSQLPGETGRAVILGHSSKPPIFTLLNKLQSGDEFYITSGNKKLVYKVFSNDILTPDQTNEILSQIPQNESNAALITCWPIGFSSKRTLIQAKLSRVEKI
ncbi:MAG: sortase [Candidatus Azambacteria bacterium]|nr:sortase [Candidatus Azambacteria bacterium]